MKYETYKRIEVIYTSTPKDNEGTEFYPVTPSSLEVHNSFLRFSFDDSETDIIIPFANVKSIWISNKKIKVCESQEEVEELKKKVNK